LTASLYEAVTHQKVAWKVAHQREFGCHHQVHVQILGRANASDDLGGIALQIARDRIYLEKCYSQCGDSRSQPELRISLV